MRIGLVSYRCENKNISFNLSQTERAMREAQGKVDLLCYGEAFLQGFDSLCWDYESDRDMAVEMGSETIWQLRQWTQQYGVALLMGYLEKEQETLYSSCIVIENGEILHNYKRISRGWKEFWKTDEHYREGQTVDSFLFRGKAVTIALCGDLWDYPEKFETDGLLIWPVYVNFTPEEWEQEQLEAYAKQAALAADNVLMVNPLDSDPVSHGGAFCFRKGEIIARLPFDREGILIVDVEKNRGWERSTPNVPSSFVRH